VSSADPASAPAPPTPTPTRREPKPSELSLPFWEATRDRKLLLQWCTACEQPIFYPRAACPTCQGTTLEWREATGRGEVYAVTVEQRPTLSSWRQEQPFAVALITLEEGVRMISNVIGCPVDDVAVGMAVVVSWEPLSDGRNLPQFSPA
jgi:uncharacterized OB-fold protein